MNPNPVQVQAIKSFVAGLSGGFAGNTDAQIRAAMVTTLVNNPVASAPTVRKPFIVDDLVAAVAAANQANVINLATSMLRFLEDVDAQDVSRLQRWGRLLKSRGLIAAADLTALAAVVNATQSDPSWAATIAWDLANLGRIADDYDIEAARHG